MSLAAISSQGCRAVAIGLLVLRDTSEGAARGGAGGRRVHALTAELFFLHGEMGGDLFAQLAIQTAAAEQRQEAVPNGAHGPVLFGGAQETVHDGGPCAPNLPIRASPGGGPRASAHRTWRADCFRRRPSAIQSIRAAPGAEAPGRGSLVEVE